MLVLDLSPYTLAIGLLHAGESLVRDLDCHRSVVFSYYLRTVSREIEYLEPKDHIIISRVFRVGEDYQDFVLEGFFFHRKKR